MATTITLQEFVERLHNAHAIQINDGYLTGKSCIAINLCTHWLNKLPSPIPDIYHVSMHHGGATTSNLISTDSITLNDDNTLTAINRFQRYVDTGTVDSKGRPLYVQTIVEEYAPITFTLLYKK